MEGVRFVVFWAAQTRKRNLRREKSAKHVEFLWRIAAKCGASPSREKLVSFKLCAGASSVCDLTFLEFWPQDLCTYPSRSHHRGCAVGSRCSVSQWKPLLGIFPSCLEAARVVNLSKVAPHVLEAGEIYCGKLQARKILSMLYMHITQ